MEQGKSTSLDHDATATARDVAGQIEKLSYLVQMLLTSASLIVTRLTLTQQRRAFELVCPLVQQLVELTDLSILCQGLALSAHLNLGAAPEPKVSETDRLCEGLNNVSQQLLMIAQQSQSRLSQAQQRQACDAGHDLAQRVAELSELSLTCRQIALASRLGKAPSRSRGASSRAYDRATEPLEVSNPDIDRVIELLHARTQ